MKPSQLAAITGAILLVGIGAGIVMSRRDVDEPHPATDAAVEALLRAAARFDAGVSLMDYSVVLADVIYAVDRLEASGEKNRLPEVADRITEAREHYQWVGRVWPLKLASGSRVWDIPSAADRDRFFGPDLESSRARAGLLRSRCLNDGAATAYVDQMVATVLSRAAELSRQAELILLDPATAESLSEFPPESEAQAENDRRETRWIAVQSALRWNLEGLAAASWGGNSELTLRVDGVWVAKLILPDDWKDRKLTPAALRAAAASVRELIAVTDEIDESRVEVSLSTSMDVILLESAASAPLGFAVAEFWLE